MANSTVPSAERLKLAKATVGKWRTRFIERRIAGLYDDVRPGKPRMIDDEHAAQLINTTLHTKPANGSTHWSVRTVAGALFREEFPDDRGARGSPWRHRQRVELQPFTTRSRMALQQKFQNDGDLRLRHPRFPG